MKKINIAIDGPSGVGKSTIAKNIAKNLNYLFINTGLMYRAVAYFCIQNKIDLNDERKVINNLNKIILIMHPCEEVSLNNINITSHLWKDEISIFASKIASYKKVREFCVQKQQKFAIEKGVVMEGRDIGSVVIPNAELKIFLVANLEVRTARRMIQLEERKIPYDKDNVFNNIKKRDELDKNRENDPLIKMPDAIEIDTSNISIEEVIKKILLLVDERISNE
ncbi:MAG: (d)CMP kinase [Mycoplasmataceae bacterium]|nr:(d)CMP kinase [Mycoplasmataceae bacterium]